MRLIRAGRLADAETAAHDCFELGIDVGEADATGYYGAHLLTIRWLQGRDAELLDLAREIAGSSTLVEPEFAYRAGVAAIAARAGLVDESKSVLGILVDGGLDSLPRSSTWLTGIANLAEAAAVLTDREVARGAHELLRPYAGRPVMPSLAITCFGSAERALGLAASTYGDLDAAVAHLERAVVDNVRLDNRPLTAMSRADLAAALLARDRPGDRAAAECALVRAVEACGEHGHGAPSQRVDRACRHDRDHRATPPCCVGTATGGCSAPGPTRLSYLTSSVSGTSERSSTVPARRSRPSSCAAAQTW